MVVAIIQTLQNGIGEHSRGVDKIHAVPADIGVTLRLVPLEEHELYVRIFVHTNKPSELRR